MVTTSGSTDTMNIVVISLRQSVVNNVSDVLNVESTSGDIGCYQDINQITLKLGKRPLALVLFLITMDRLGFKALPRKIDG
ncbi:MAG: hypothetical protein BWY68_00625 [bacterium ADurb.Bin400]|nr:MAG: hypothetical protein BWY68_00625 [bacterium ADurb.Bin400]